MKISNTHYPLLHKGILIVFAATFIFTSLVAVRTAISQIHSEPNSNSAIDRSKSSDPPHDLDAMLLEFTRVAFSDVLWDEDRHIPENAIHHYKAIANGSVPTPKELTEKVPGRRYGADIPNWIIPYKDRMHGVPEVGVINKWSGEVTIGFDWPRYGFSLPSQRARIRINQHRLDPNRSAYATTQKHIESIIPLLEEATGLSISFLPPDNPSEATENHARVRIILEDQFSSANFFKSIRTPGALSEKRWVDGQIVGGVRFTPYAPAQVEGYFVPDADNNITFAACSLNPDVMSSTLLNALITECLIRVLGLPALLTKDNRSVLSNWGKSFNSISRLEANDGAYLGYHADIPPIEIATEQLRLAEDQFSDTIPKNITQYDKYMLSLLYCDDVKPGMDKAALLIALLGHSKCTKTFIK